MPATKFNATQVAAEFDARCKKYGWSYSIRGSVVTVQAHFAAGNTDAFCRCDSEGYELLDLLPANKYDSSVWGTDGGSIGGAVGLSGGYYRLNKSSIKATVLKALAKLAHTRV